MQSMQEAVYQFIFSTLQTDVLSTVSLDRVTNIVQRIISQNESMK